MYDVIVIGVGTMGAAACDVLARRGVKVLGIDQFSPPHDRGSHHGDTRMFRMAYYEHPDYVPLLKRSRELWLELNQWRSSRGDPEPLTCYHEVGGLYMGPADGELVAGSAQAAREHSLQHEVLSPQAIRERFPQFVLPTGYNGLYEPHAGFVMTGAIARMIQRAELNGAVISRNERVLGWTVSPDGVSVRTEFATSRAKSLIVTSGAWTSRLVGDLGIELVVTRQVLGWVQLHHRVQHIRTFEAGGPDRPWFPCWAIDNCNGSLHYGFPVLYRDKECCLKMAKHVRGRAADPDALDREVTPEDEAEFRSVIGRHLPGADGPTSRTEVCMYTNSPDSHFIIDRVPGQSRVVVACGFSGHGFKFAPMIGEAVADLAMYGKSELPIEFLGLSRFRN